MLQSDYDGENFYLFVLDLFSKAGHVFTSIPEFNNHSPEQFVFFDNKSDMALSHEQRVLFQVFDNVSRLFTVNNCAFFSINLLTTKDDRSQAAHDIHTMVHPITGMEGTVCVFRYNDEVMLSFSGFGYRCILSDWYPMEDDFDHLLDKLDIANMSISREEDYFNDMIYSLARYYYLHDQPTTYELLPIDFISNAGIEGVDRDEIDRQIEYELAATYRNYGEDYVEYDESTVSKGEDIGAELDMMLLEMDDDNDNPFGEEIEPEDDYLDEDDSFDDDEDAERDYYEFDDVDPEIFRDPTLMVKWINKNE